VNDRIWRQAAVRKIGGRILMLRIGDGTCGLREENGADAGTARVAFVGSVVGIAARTCAKM
jgi:hypothetical protein